MLLAGYNTMPKDERDKIDKQELSKTAGNLMLRMALELALVGVATYFGLTMITIVLIVIFVADSCIVAVRMFRKTPKTTTSKSGPKTVIAVAVIFVIAAVILLYYGEKEPVVRILDDKIQIEAMYGLDIDFSDVSAVSLIDKSMQDIGAGERNNGYGGFGETLKGHFNSENLGKFMLFVKSESPATLWIERDGQENIYISFDDVEKTNALYQQLIAAVP